MEEWKKAVLNAGIMAGITALSILMATQEVNAETVKAVIVSFGVTFLTLCSRYFKPPQTDVNDEVIDADGAVVESQPTSKHILSLWV